MAIFAFAVVVVLGGLFYVLSPSSSPGQYDEFAKCLTEKGVKFYGAFWCSHCNAQKALFGNSMKYVNYIECSTPDGQGQLQVCSNAEITGYPTWEFADGSRANGELSFATLASKTGCALG